MPYYLLGGDDSGGGEHTARYDLGTNNVVGTVVTPAPGGLVSGLSVSLYTSTDGVTYALQGTGTTDATGNYSIAAGTVTGATYFRVSVAYTGTGDTYTAYVPAYTPAVLNGSSGLRWTSSLIPTADLAVGTATITAGSVSGWSLTGVGGHFDPGQWQIITLAGGNTTPARGMVQALADGTLDPTTITFTGTGPDGIALSLGTGYGGSSAAMAVSHRASRLITVVRFKPSASPAIANADYLMSNYLALQFLTAGGLKYRQDYQTNGTLVRINTTTILSTSLMQTAAFNVDAVANTCQAYLDGANNLSGTPTITPANAPDLRAMTNFTLGANSNTTPGNFPEGQIEFIWIGGAYDAIDTISGTGTTPDFSSPSVQDRLLPQNINLTNGTGLTGRQPWIFMTGADLKANINRGRSGNASTIIGSGFL
jgi:hypothetical protein